MSNRILQWLHNDASGSFAGYSIVVYQSLTTIETLKKTKKINELHAKAYAYLISVEVDYQ